ncbi:hypothetical protein T4C_3586 [Trichinella pseudospiralis]|uniref:Uncharacterized protein n=1 Tax=Trichinella pseudospiralis TaxID=6337 RepID=A0A0V1JK16_TRIPS|nr:hypothetical protein T4C_3586 [Trichinella pseudospiralis]
MMVWFYLFQFCEQFYYKIVMDVLKHVCESHELEKKNCCQWPKDLRDCNHAFKSAAALFGAMLLIKCHL